MYIVYKIYGYTKTHVTLCTHTALLTQVIVNSKTLHSLFVDIHSTHTYMLYIVDKEYIPAQLNRFFFVYYMSTKFCNFKLFAWLIFSHQFKRNLLVFLVTLYVDVRLQYVHFIPTYMYNTYLLRQNTKLHIV